MDKLSFEKLQEGISRLCVPFEGIYTSVFLLEEGGKYALLDCATDREDVLNYVLPALAEVGAVPEYLICSHFHSDHSGGLDALMEAFKEAKIVYFDKGVNLGERAFYAEDGELIFGSFELLKLPGHTHDSLAVLDRRTMALLTCDCLQMFGISRWGTGVSDHAAYEKSICRVEALGISEIIASHDYYPLGFSAKGKDVAAFLGECRHAVKHLRDFVLSHPTLSDSETAELYMRENPELPTIYAHNISVLKQFLI